MTDPTAAAAAPAVDKQPGAAPLPDADADLELELDFDMDRRPPPPEQEQEREEDELLDDINMIGNAVDDHSDAEQEEEEEEDELASSADEDEAGPQENQQEQGRQPESSARSSEEPDPEALLSVKRERHAEWERELKRERQREEEAEAEEAEAAERHAEQKRQLALEQQQRQREQRHGELERERAFERELALERERERELQQMGREKAGGDNTLLDREIELDLDLDLDLDLEMELEMERGPGAARSPAGALLPPAGGASASASASSSSNKQARLPHSNNSHSRAPVAMMDEEEDDLEAMLAMEEELEMEPPMEDEADDLAWLDDDDDAADPLHSNSKTSQHNPAAHPRKDLLPPGSEDVDLFGRPIYPSAASASASAGASTSLPASLGGARLPRTRDPKQLLPPQSLLPPAAHPGGPTGRARGRGRGRGRFDDDDDEDDEDEDDTGILAVFEHQRRRQVRAPTAAAAALLDSGGADAAKRRGGAESSSTTTSSTASRAYSYAPAVFLGGNATRDAAGLPKYIPAPALTARGFDGQEVRIERRRRMRLWQRPAPGTTAGGEGGAGAAAVQWGATAQGGDAYASTSTGAGGAGAGFLARPIHHMIDEIEKAELAKSLQLSEQARAEGGPTTDPSTTITGGAAAAGEGGGEKAEAAEDGRMWVDRYRPRRFPDLLGDERVFREVMGWIKQWDQCVFKRRPTGAAAAKRARAQAFGSGSNAPAPFRGKGFPGGGNGGEQQPYFDAFGRPQEKILLLSGPPGLGKTTLAHVIAQQAGYGVFEMNASDARTTAAVEETIRNALESASLKDPRPTLVVIDEIDGATGGGGGGAEGGGDGKGGGGGGGFVRALVKLIQNGVSTGGKSKARGKDGKKKKQNKPLLRPIICICNDLYASSLRPLRPLAKLVRLQKTSTLLLVNRLRAICEREALSADARALSLLAELTAGDIRSCLNALQFAQTRGGGTQRLTEAYVRSADLGIKDGSTSLARVWDLVFRTPDAKKRARGGAPRDEFEVTQRIVHEAQLSGEYDKLAQGCFELYPSLKRLKDDGWHRYEKVHDWLHFAQTLLDSPYRLGTYELMGFVPWTFVPWHHQFANTHNLTPEYPRADYEVSSTAPRVGC